jgi:hypothetical protein
MSHPRVYAKSQALDSRKACIPNLQAPQNLALHQFLAPQSQISSYSLTILVDIRRISQKKHASLLHPFRKNSSRVFNARTSHCLRDIAEVESSQTEGLGGYPIPDDWAARL